MFVINSEEFCRELLRSLLSVYKTIVMNLKEVCTYLSSFPSHQANVTAYRVFICDSINHLNAVFNFTNVAFLVSRFKQVFFFINNTSDKKS
jgi:hypothetical protein